MKRPTAHIRGGCSTGVSEHWVFEHAARAVLFYDARTNPGTPIVACAKCCDAIVAREGMERLREQVIREGEGR